MESEALLETPEGSEPTRTRLRITRGTTDIGKAILRPSSAVAFGYVGNVDVGLARKLDRIRATLYCVLHR